MKHILVFLVAGLAAVGMAGCGSRSLDQNSKAFASAPAPLKESWTKAVACVRSKDYAGAAPLLFNLRTQSLTPDQSAAVEAAVKTVTEELWAAADRGDPAAKQAIEDLKKRARR